MSRCKGTVLRNFKPIHIFEKKQTVNCDNHRAAETDIEENTKKIRKTY